MECTSAEPLLLLAADAWTKKSSVSCRRRALSLESLESHKSHNSIRCLLSQRKELWLSHNECPSGGFQSGPGPGTRRALKLGTQRCLNGTHPFKDPMYEMLTYRLMDHRKPRQRKCGFSTVPRLTCHPFLGSPRRGSKRAVLVGFWSVGPIQSETSTDILASAVRSNDGFFRRTSRCLGVAPDRRNM